MQRLPPHQRDQRPGMDEHATHPAGHPFASGSSGGDAAADAARRQWSRGSSCAGHAAPPRAHCHHGPPQPWRHQQRDSGYDACHATAGGGGYASLPQQGGDRAWPRGHDGDEQARKLMRKSYAGEHNRCPVMDGAEQQRLGQSSADGRADHWRPTHAPPPHFERGIHEGMHQQGHAQLPQQGPPWDWSSGPGRQRRGREDVGRDGRRFEGDQRRGCGDPMCSSAAAAHSPAPGGCGGGSGGDAGGFCANVAGMSHASRGYGAPPSGHAPFSRGGGGRGRAMGQRNHPSASAQGEASQPWHRRGPGGGRGQQRGRGGGGASGSGGAGQVNPRMLSSKISRAGDIDELLELLSQYRSELNYIHVSNLWNKLGAKLRDRRNRSDWLLTHDREMSELAELSLALLEGCSPQGFANIAHGVAHCGFESEAASRLFAAIAAEALPRLQQFKPQEFSNLLWAFAKAGHGAPELFDAAAREAPSMLHQFQDINLSNIVHAFASAGHPAPELFDAVSRFATRSFLAASSPQAIANILWGFAKAGHTSEPALQLFREVASLFEASADAPARSLHDFKPQELANLVWAFAMVEVPAPQLFEQTAREAATRLLQFEPRHLASLVHGFASAHHEAPALFAAVADAALQPNRISGFAPQAIANTACAYANLSCPAPKLFSALAIVAQQRLGEFKPLELSNTLWAFATAGYPAPALFDAASETVRRQFRTYDTAHLANTLHAFAVLAHGAPELFSLLSEEVQNRMDEFKPEELTSVLMAFARIGYEAHELFESVAGSSGSFLASFQQQEAANVAWAFAATDSRHPLFLQRLRARVLRLIDEMRLENLVQLQQWQLWIQLELKLPALLLPEAARKRCTDSLRAHEVHPSQFQTEVARVVSDLVPDMTEELITPEGLSIDVALPSRKVAIEADGPVHFMQSGVGAFYKPTGRTVLKRRLVRALGWKLITVPSSEWYELKDPGAKRSYMQRKLRDCEDRP